MTMIVESSHVINYHEVELSNGELLDYAKKDIARSIGMFLLKEGFIDFDVIPDGEKYYPKTYVVGALGVKTIDEVASVKQQLNEARIEGAKEALNTLIEKVNRWGSYYGQKEVAKWEVELFADDVLRSMENG